MIEPSAIHLVAALIGALAIVILALAVFLPQATDSTRHRSYSENEGKLSSLAARVPIAEIRDGLVVRRDGSFCAGWECSGVATQFANAERLETVSTALDAFIKSIRHPEIELQLRYVINPETPRVLEERIRLLPGSKRTAPCSGAQPLMLASCARSGFWRCSPGSRSTRGKPAPQRRALPQRSGKGLSRTGSESFQVFCERRSGKLAQEDSFNATEKYTLVFSLNSIKSSKPTASASKQSLQFADSVRPNWLNCSTTP